MCPGTLALASVAVTAASDVAGGIAQANVAKYQAHVANNNAAIAAQNASHAAAAGSVATTEEGLRQRAALGNVRAGLAAQGVDANSGSAADVQQSQREIGALDTSAVANRAAEAVYGYGAQESGYQAQAKLDNAEAPLDVLGGFTKAAGSLLSAGPNLPDPYQWMASNAGSSMGQSIGSASGGGGP